MLQYIKEFDLHDFCGPTNIEDMPVLYGYLPLNFIFFSFWRSLNYFCHSLKNSFFQVKPWFLTTVLAIMTVDCVQDCVVSQDCCRLNRIKKARESSNFYV